MPSEGAMLLSDYGGEPVGVICEKCQTLKFLNVAELMLEFGDLPMPTLLHHISQSVLKCEKTMVGFSDRCGISYYKRANPIEQLAKPASSRKVSELRAWEVVVVKCRFCGHVSNIPQWRMRNVDKDKSLDQLGSQMRCQKCRKRGEVKITVAKMPR